MDSISPFPIFRLRCVALAASLLVASLEGWAAPISFSQIPAGNGGREPAPNVIISVDDSGSMAWDVTTDNATTVTANQKITLLKSALKAQFGNGTSNSGNIPDGRIRLAWQGMNRTNTLTPGATNSMKPFTGAHRTNFNSFVDGLYASGGTPSIKMMKNVYDYMRTPVGDNSPWADNPGTAQTTPYLACRRTYHVFMTDGAWNGQLDTDRVENKGDSSTQTLGDGTTVYNPSTNTQLRIYKDRYGDGDENATNRTTKAHTLADFAFRNWATDLQDGTGSTQAMANSIRPLIKKSGNELVWGTPPASSATLCTEANDCTVLSEFWSPKNDPATWQHVTQYTIGFGLGAVNWPYVTNLADATSRRTSTTASVISTRKTPADWDYNNSALDTYGGDYVNLIRGKLEWPQVFSYDRSVSTSDVNGEVGTAEQDQRTVELWHAAINGRGKYYPAKTASALAQAFSDIMDTVIRDTSSPLVSISTSSSYLRSGLNAYIAGYNATKYSGSLTARPIDGTSGAIGATEVWNASAKLDALNTTGLANRLILSYGDFTVSGVTESKGFIWKPESSTSIANLPTLHKTPLNKNSAGTVDNKGLDRVNYIRGDRTKEIANGGTFRDRDSRMGDIVNSNIWYTGKPASGYTTDGYATFKGTAAGGYGNRTPMIYVGANDGMLHGFSANTGDELIAYIPQAIAQGSLRELTDGDISGTATPYVHKYFVDGTPFTGDFYNSSTSKWSTVLVGTLAAGGKGYFILDVTDPSKFSITNSSVADLVVMDTTATTDADIGFIFSPPVMDEAIANMSLQIVKLNNSRWAAVLGNGYNSTNEAPVLLIQYLDGAKELFKVSPCTLPTSLACSFKGTNGLSSPQIIDVNGDGKVDVAYAGDLQGNLWKFDLTSATATNWKASFNKQPFFVAKRGSVTQAFTTAPYWLPHPNGGIMLAIGTGRNLSDADRSTTATESVYALYDNSTFKVVSGVVEFTDTTPINTTTSTTFPTTLVQQTISSTPLVDSGTSYFTSSNNIVDYVGTPASLGVAAVPAHRGWYLDWPLASQRTLQNIRSFTGQKIMVQSLIPKVGGNSTVESCSASATTERSFQTVLNMFTGAPPATPAFSFTDTQTFTSSKAKTVTMVESSAGDTTIIRSEGKTKLLSSNCPAGQVCNAKDFNPGNYTGIRVGFRQIQ